MASIRLEAIEKVHPGGAVALRGIDLAAGDGELLVLVGPSGCGKSTLLRVVAGLEEPSRGRVLLDGRDVSALAPRERDLAMVFQSYALYPHLSVADNLGFALRLRGTPPAERARRVADVARRLGLEGVLGRRPAALSGGQRQRVALGRALARCRPAGAEPGSAGDGPAALLLDEPLSNLDAALRLETRAELARLHRELGVTMLYVTHDQEEALTLGQRIAVLRDGRIEQLAPPREVYHRPATRFVAGFVGTPAIDWFEVRVEAAAGGALLLRCADLGVAAPLGLDLSAGQRVLLGIRPHDLEPVSAEPGERDGPGDPAPLRGRAEVVEPLGTTTVVHARSDTGTPFRVVVPGDAHLALGDGIAVRARPGALHLFDPATGCRIGDPSRGRGPGS